MPSTDWEESVLREAETLYAQARPKVGTRTVEVDGITLEPSNIIISLVGADILFSELGYQVRITD